MTLVHSPDGSLWRSRVKLPFVGGVVRPETATDVRVFVLVPVCTAPQETARIVKHSAE